MRKIAIIATHGVVPFDLATPLEVFGRTRLADGRAAYQVRVCGVARGVDAGSFRLRTPFSLRHAARADTWIVPGLHDPLRPPPPALLTALRAAARRGTRIASICTGAFVLAAAGLLDGRRATTHWLAAGELSRRHPSVRVEPDVLYVDEGRILTSAGAAAGLDLCLQMVRRDFGAAVAAASARVSVMPLERDGGQAQFIVHAPPSTDESLQPLLRWMEQNLHRRLHVPSLARHAAMSERTLARQFRRQTGTTPARWILQARIRRAQELLERSAHSIDRIADEAGFGSTASLRARFAEIVGASPRDYRRAFRR